jgi:hypothetical protein
MEKEQSPLASRSMKARVPGHEVLATGQGGSNGLKDSVSTHGRHPESSNGHAPREARVWQPFVSHSRRSNAAKRAQD